MSSSTGTTVSAETTGNISLAPYLSVSAPAGDAAERADEHGHGHQQ